MALIGIDPSLTFHFSPPRDRSRKIFTSRSASSPKMPLGKLKVLLVGAKGLENTDYLCEMDCYVILTCHTQEHKSSIASGKGTEPHWEESFEFTIHDGETDLELKIFDSDSGTGDDFVGEATISLEPVFSEGELPPTVFNVVKDQEYRGEIKLGLTFTREGKDCGLDEENMGGWKQSSFD